MPVLPPLWLKRWSASRDYPHVFLPGIGLGLILSLFSLVTHRAPVSDALFYREIALGNLALVQQPFAGRLLHPLFVFAVDTLTPLSVDQSFLVIGVALIFALSIGLCWLRRELHISLLYFILVILSPALFFLSRDYYLTDLAQSVALIFLFIAIVKKGLGHGSTLLLLALSFLIRESTLLVAVSMGAVAIFHRDQKTVYKILSITVMAWILLGVLSRWSLPNIHHLPSSIYLLLKVPFNGLHNLAGINLTSNTLDANAGRTLCTIVRTISLPSLSFLGEFRSVSLCRPDWSYPLNTLLLMLTTFGTLPLLLFRSLRKQTGVLQKSPLVIQIMCLYGLLAFFFAPLFGSSLDRLLAMGWPAFLITVPFLVSKKPSYKITGILLISTCFAWIGLRFLPSAFLSSTRLHLQVLGTLVVYGLTYVLLRAVAREEPIVPATTLLSETSRSR